MPRWLTSRTLEALQRVTPKGARAVVYGHPPDEGNALEVIRALSRRYRGAISWLVDPELMPSGINVPPNVEVIPKRSPSAMARYLSAEIVFFTHGLYGDAMPTAGQSFVNLWHGDGVKVETDRARARRPMHPSHFVVGGTSLLTHEKARIFRVARSGELLTGNPRVDQFAHEVPDAFWDEVGIDRARPFVLWLPTFRSARGYGATAGWSDTVADEHEVNRTMTAVAEHLMAAGVQVLVKPHPLDAQPRSLPGCSFVDNATLAGSGTSLYAVLGRSAGLVTDYSSVWTDYLLLDRPIGFVVPDADAYAEGRGLYPSDVLDWLPGRHLDDPAQVSAFASELRGCGDSTAHLRRQAAQRLGLVRSTTVADDLLDALEARGAFPVSHTLDPRSAPGPATDTRLSLGSA